MSFNVVTAQWIVKILFLYSLMVLVLPYLVMRRYLRGKTTAQKFVICTVVGNFFYIMMVLGWGLLHITNRYVLIATTLVLPLWMLLRRRRRFVQGLRPVWHYAVRFVRRENSFRFCVARLLQWLRRTLGALLAPAVRRLRQNGLEWLLFAGCGVFALWFFSITNHFGPRASDLVVHMLWINEVDAGSVFGEGIYPFGMHAMIYYLHAVFDIPTARLILLFGTVQAMYIFLMLLAFLKEMCRYRYTPYLAYVAFLAGNFIQSGRYSRYYSALPQEFGMVFLLPCAVALICFFRSARQERKSQGPPRPRRTLRVWLRALAAGEQALKLRESTLWLWVLILSFGLTLSAHFYITIIAGLLVVAAAVAYLFETFRWSNLRRLVVAGVLSLAISIAPMAIAFIGGTPLQSSLYWALEVMGIESSSQSVSEASSQTVQSADSAPAAPVQTGTAETAPASQPEQTASRMDWKYIENTVRQTSGNFLSNLILETEWDVRMWILCMLVLAAEIPLLWLLREWEQGSFRILVLVYHGLLLFMSIAGYLGLPALMDENRSSIFFAYTALVCVSLAADGVLILLNRLIRWRHLGNLLSLVLVAALVTGMVSGGRLREKVVNESSLQSDGAALCVFDIMENYPEQKWTIVSCNEERNMVSTVAWHYEVIDFLQSMEDYQPTDEMYIPTQYVFFFVEKNVLNYAISPEFTDVDGHVSEQWAENDLPAKSGLSQYTSYNRITVNSRLYYWAQEYQKRFPNEMKVYYEDEDFVCYFIEQNEYYLNNFAIDYGYNSGGQGE